jgi:hypothetical protein
LATLAFKTKGFVSKPKLFFGFEKEKKMLQ